MTGLLGILALGFFLGMRHATDADHVIAVTAIVARQRTAQSALLVGAAWGLGHTLTILIVGGGIVLFGWVIPERLGLSFELGVAVMLIVLGIANLGSLRGLIAETLAAARTGRMVHSHPHAHGDYVHTHPHGHDPEAHPHGPQQTPVAGLDRRFGRLAGYRLVRPLVVGIVHGLAGSAAIALLVLPTIQNPEWALLYLLVFGAGTIGGMTLITWAIAVPLGYVATPSGPTRGRLVAALRIASGLISICFGGYLLYRVGFVQGLFFG